jgi:hypothetical protein
MRWLSCVAVLWLTIGVCGAAELEVGAAKVDITPPVGYRMSGYFYERLSTGTHDPLWAKAIVFRQGSQQAALVFCDLIGISRQVSSEARRKAAEKTGISAANILIAATHSHTGPLYAGVLRDHFHKLAVARDGKDAAEAVDYSALLVGKLVEAIAAARTSAKAATLSAGSATQQGLSFNRRFHMKDGTVVFNPGKLNPNIVRVAGPIDPDVGFVLARGADDRPLAVLSVFAMHLDTVSGTLYSADYPHYLERDLAKAFGPDCVSLFGAGTCGDINHIDVSHDRPQGGQAEAERIGTTLAATVSANVKQLGKLAAPSLAVRQTMVEAPLQQYAPERVALAQEELFKVGTRERSFLEQVETCKIVKLAALGKTIPLEVQVFRLGDELALVGLPGEVFVELGLAIKQASPFKHTLVIELCNDAPAYIPTKKAFAEGSYETVNSLVAPGGGEMLVEAAIKMLKELRPAK